MLLGIIMATREIVQADYKGIVVPHAHFYEFLGALITEADSQGYRIRRVMDSEFPASKAYNALQDQMHGGLHYSNLPVGYFNGKPYYFEGTTSDNTQETMEMTADEAWCVENGLRTQIVRMRHSAQAIQTAPGFVEQLLIDRKEKLADMLHVYVRDSAFHKKQLPATYALKAH
jgi:hypothetical protein